MTRPIDTLNASILGRPVAWPRTTVVLDDQGVPRSHNPKAYREWKTEAAAKLAAFAGYRTFTGEVSVVVDVTRGGLSIQVQGLDREDPRRSPTGLTGDVDNYAKAALDALQASAVLGDDAQVSELTVRFRP